MTLMSFAILTGFTTKTGWTLPDECPVMVREGNRYSLEDETGLMVYEDNGSDVIFVGDSRAAFMMKDTGYKGVSWVTMPGRGAACLADRAIPSIASSLAGKTVVFVIGINDISPLRNSYERMQLMNWYTAYYKALVANNPSTVFYVTGVTMRGNLTTPQYVRFNNAIQFFNNRMSSIPGMHYIDTFGYLLATGYGYLSPEDTLHYDADTNRRLFRYIMKTVTGEDVELPPIPEPAEPEVPVVAGQMAEPQQEEASALQQAETSAQQPVDASGQQLAETVLQQAEPVSSAVIADLADATVDPDDIDPQPVDGTAQRGDAAAQQGDAATQTEGANSQN